MLRKPLALANWKMTMTVAESLTFVRDSQAHLGELLAKLDLVICPPYTALWPVAQELRDRQTRHGSTLHLGGQNCAATSDIARTGEISAELLADAGCRWVMLGHWETRRYLDDDDTTVNQKLHLALAAGLTPILLVGEGKQQSAAADALAQQLPRILEGCPARQVATLTFVYEPEGKIGLNAPAGAKHVGRGCALIREWVRTQFDDTTAAQIRIIYGGSVTPEHAADLLAHPDVDGLGASSRGRDAATFAAIVRQIAQAKLTDNA
jgi:triosephosphate isomerase